MSFLAVPGDACLISSGFGILLISILHVLARMCLFCVLRQCNIRSPLIEHGTTIYGCQFELMLSAVISFIVANREGGLKVVY